MKSTDNRNLISTIIASQAASGNIRPIPQAQPTPGNGEASLDVGFPPETFLSKAAGGIPPSGQDMNGFLSLLSSAIQNIQANNFGIYNSEFSQSIGGYPLNAVVSSGTAGAFWVSTTENNMTIPDTPGGAWNNLFAGLAALAGNANQTFSVAPGTGTQALQAQQAFEQISFNATTTINPTANVTNIKNNVGITSGQTLTLGSSQFQGQQVILESESSNTFNVVTPNALIFPDNSVLSGTSPATPWTFGSLGNYGGATLTGDGNGNWFVVPNDKPLVQAATSPTGAPQLQQVQSAISSAVNGLASETWANGQFAQRAGNSQQPFDVWPGSGTQATNENQVSSMISSAVSGLASETWANGQFAQRAGNSKQPFDVWPGSGTQATNANQVSSMISSAVSGLASEAWVNGHGYITETQGNNLYPQLSGYGVQGSIDGNWSVEIPINDSGLVLLYQGGLLTGVHQQAQIAVTFKTPYTAIYSCVPTCVTAAWPAGLVNYSTTSFTMVAGYYGTENPTEMASFAWKAFGIYQKS